MRNDSPVVLWGPVIEIGDNGRFRILGNLLHRIPRRRRDPARMILPGKIIVSDQKTHAWRITRAQRTYRWSPRQTKRREAWTIENSFIHPTENNQIRISDRGHPARLFEAVIPVTG